jgi:hypothetical protein
VLTNKLISFLLTIFFAIRQTIIILAVLAVTEPCFYYYLVAVESFAYYFLKLRNVYAEFIVQAGEIL